MKKTTVLRCIAEVWQQIALFHPQIKQQTAADTLLLQALNTIDKIETTAQLLACLNQFFLHPLQDPLSFAQYQNEANPQGDNKISVHYEQQHTTLYLNNINCAKQQLAHILTTNISTIWLDCRTLSPSYYPALLQLFAQFAQQQQYTIPVQYRQHHGWQESQETYIYQTVTKTQTKTLNFTDIAAYSIKLQIIIANPQLLHLADYLQALQTEENIHIIWEQQGLFIIPETHLLQFDTIAVHINHNINAFKPDYICSHFDLNHPTWRDYPKPSPICISADNIKPTQYYLAGFIKLYQWVKRFSPHLEQTIWHRAWDEFLPKIQACKDLNSYQKQLSDLLNKLNDKHSRVIFKALQATNPAQQTAIKAVFFAAAMAHIKILSHRIAYMTPFSIEDTDTLSQAFALIEDSSALILDLRAYPRCHFKHELIQHLCQDEIYSPRYEIPLISPEPCAVQQYKTLQYRLPAEPKRNIYQQPIVALIDHNVYSAAEDVCMYLKHSGKVTFIGTASADCMGNICFIDLPFDGYAGFTGMSVRNLDGSKATAIEPAIQLKADDDFIQRAVDYLIQQHHI